jgi:hypothetical protein
LDLETLVDDFMTFFVAGQETTANTLAFCFQELGRHPDIFLKYEHIILINMPKFQAYKTIEVNKKKILIDIIT